MCSRLVFSRGNSRTTTLEAQLSQETGDNDYSDFSTRGVSSCFGFPLCSHLLPCPLRFSPEERTTRSRRVKRVVKDDEESVQPPKARLTPAGHEENGVLPTINSPLPLFLTLAVCTKGEGYGGSARAPRRRDRNEIEKRCTQNPFARVFLSPLDAPRVISRFFFFSRYFPLLFPPLTFTIFLFPLFRVFRGGRVQVADQVPARLLEEG